LCQLNYVEFIGCSGFFADFAHNARVRAFDRSAATPFKGGSMGDQMVLDSPPCRPNQTSWSCLPWHNHKLAVICGGLQEKYSSVCQQTSERVKKASIAVSNEKVRLFCVPSSLSISWI
jgi:hypothetical protein